MKKTIIDQKKLVSQARNIAVDSEQHGESCVLKTVKHGDHVDYVHDGHIRRIHGRHIGNGDGGKADKT